MQKVAITGNIASGKTQVEKIIERFYPVYDTDKIAHKKLDSIDYFYGYDVFTEGKIDRKKLGQLVFSNKDLKAKLESTIHPMVKQELENIFEEHKNEEFVFVSVPLLFEAGFENLFDKIILVTIDEDTRLKRLLKRDNLSKEEAEKRINSQIPESEKISKVDFVVNNDKDINSLTIAVEKIITQLQSSD